MAFDVKGFQQPDYQVNPVAGNKYEPQDGMTQLSNILDYQKKQATLGSDIAKSQAESQKSVTGAQSEQLALATKKMNVIRQAQVAHITDPIVTRAASDPNFAQQPDTIKHIQNLINEQGQTAIDQGIDPNTVKQQLMPYHQIAQSQPQQFQQFLKSRLIAGLDTQAQSNLNSLNTVGGQSGQYNKAANTFVPANIAVGNTQTTTENGSTQPSGNGATSLNPLPQPEQPNIVAIDKNFVTNNPSNMTTPQKERYDYGRALIIDSAGNTDKVQSGLQTVREINKYAQQAAGSVPGQLLRSGGKWVAGNADYETLLKNLALNQQLSAQRMGVKTDLGAETNATANGSGDITEKALRRITNRAEADLSAVSKFNEGLQHFTEKHGQINGPMNAEQFQQAWAKNYDTRVFMRQRINASNMDNMQKAMAIQELEKGMTDQDRRDLRQKAENLKRLQRGDYAKGY